MLPETEYRRETFDEEFSEAVVLADGQEWYFPKPWLAFRPVFRDGKPVDSVRYFSCGPELDSLLEAISSAETLTGQLMAAMALAGLMLLRNYDLTDEELATVLVYRPGDPESSKMLSAIIAIATGNSGKKA